MYELLTWKEDYHTTNEAVDYQHKALINIINDLIGTFNSFDGDPNAVLIEVQLDELFKFAAHSFAPEELVMKNSHYPQLVQHHELHIQFVLTLIQLKVRLDKDENIAKELIDFLLSWLKNHICQADKEAMSACK